MSLSRSKCFVKRCQSSMLSVKDFQRHFCAESQLKNSGVVNKASTRCGKQKSSEVFGSAVESKRRIPQEEKTKSRRMKEFLTNSWQKDPRSGLPKKTQINLTGHCNSKEITSCNEELTIQNLNKEQANDECFFNNAFMLTSNADGRRSRQEFISGHADEQAPTETLARFDVLEDKINSFMSFDCGSTPHPKKGFSRIKSRTNAQTLPEKEAHFNFNDETVRAASQPRQAMSQGSIVRLTKISPLSGDLSLMEEGSSFDLVNNIPSEHSKTMMSPICGVAARPKKRDSTRRPNFTEDLMLSRDIDQILEEEVDGFESIEKANDERSKGMARRGYCGQVKIAEQKLLEMDIEYILNDDIPARPSSNPQKKSFLNNGNVDDNDLDAHRDVHSTFEEKATNSDLRAIKSATHLRGMFRSRKRMLGRKKSDNEEMEEKSLPRIGDQTKLPTEKKPMNRNEIELDETINEILEIPVIDSNIPTKGKVEKIIASDVAALASKQRSNAQTNRNMRRAVPSGSCDAGYKIAQDHTIEELVEELFPDLLPYVLPLYSICNDIIDGVARPLGRDSASSVIEADALRPMTAGLSETPSVLSYSRGRCRSTCSKKWTTEVMYTDEELKLMEEVERDYSVRKR